MDRIIAKGCGFEFWKIGDNVYRVQAGAALDSWGLPMGRRWESTLTAWNNFKATVFAWAEEVQ